MGAAIAVAVWLSAAADAGTTHYALRHGLVEANPIIRVMGVQSHPARVWPIKAMASMYLIAATKKMPPKQRHWTRGAVAVIWTAASVWNWQQIRKHGR